MLDLIRTCKTCEGSMEGKRSNAVYCSRKCKDADYWLTVDRDKYRRSPEQRERHKAYMRKYHYGITQEEHEWMFEAQGRRCANQGCRTEETRGTGWHTDHDHVTGKVRGILCHDCNLMLGNAKDSIERLEGAIEYLRRQY